MTDLSPHLPLDPPAQPSSDGLAARRAAFDLLQQVLIERRLFDEALAAGMADTPPGSSPGSSTRSSPGQRRTGGPGGGQGRRKQAAPKPAGATIGSLSSRDRAFARLLVGVTLRRLGQLDALIAHAVSRPLPKAAAAVRDVLRLGICQLLFLQTPHHAAVSTSVDLVETVQAGSFKGLVNAVLRRLAEEGPDLLRGQDAARLNTPGWLWKSWVEAWGGDKARAIATAHLGEAPLDISVVSDPDHWATVLSGVALPTGSVRRAAGGVVTDLPGFDDGAWWVQDMAAALPVRLLGPVAGLRVLDMCAAPGGKTAQLAAAGARVTAVDRSAKRLNIVRRNLDRLHLDAELIASDAMLLQPAELFDAVLLDAPCSATGTIRRHPDIARLKGANDIVRLAATQRQLLRRAVDLVRPGGLIVWCTCSLQPEEGELQTEQLIAEGAPVDRVPVDASEIGGLAEAITARGEVRTLPCFSPHLAGVDTTDGTVIGAQGMDGFHMARLRRR